MILSPTLEMFSRFTATDGALLGGWLCWTAWMVRRAANRLWASGRLREAQNGRWVALLLFAAGGAAAFVGWRLDPDGGPTLWGGLAALGWCIGAVNVWWHGRKGRPLL